ncbi:Uma2 family endonuclease [bacterium]|nr:Uma2 family endonuclease [bacterium]
MTLAEFFAQPETNRITQLINGEYIANPPLDKHQAVVGSTFVMLSLKTAGGTLRIAPTGLYLQGEDFYEPDIFWVAEGNTRCTLRPDGRYWEGTPDLIVEVLSPSTALYDKREKFAMYENHAVREYWMIDPLAEFLEAWVLTDHRFTRLGTFGPRDTFASPILNSQTIDLAEIF